MYVYFQISDQCAYIDDRMGVGHENFNDNVNVWCSNPTPGMNKFEVILYSLEIYILLIIENVMYYTFTI